MATVNEVLQDLAIRHGISLERLKSAEVKRLLDILGEANAKTLNVIEARIKRLGPVETQEFGFGKVTTERQIALQKAIQELEEEAFAIVHGDLVKTMVDVGKAEVAFMQGSFISTIDLNVEFSKVSNTTLRTLVRARPFAGKYLREHASQWSRGTRERVTAAIRTSIIRGQRLDDTTKAVRLILDNSNAGAERIARSAIGHISNATRQATYEENSDVIKGVKIVTTLDSRRCKECMFFEGKVYPIRSGPRPIFHLNCRCTTVPVTSVNIGAGKRASSKGEVPADISTPDFFKKLTKAEQEDVLGVTGRQLWKDGKLPLDGFTDRTGRPFNLDELAARNAENFKRAGLDPDAFMAGR